MSDRRLPGGDLRVVLRPAIVSTSSPQVLAEDLVPSLLAGRSGAVVVDLGCGGGDSVEVFFRVGRVLRSGGIFAGSTSHLEPCHGYSIANFTPYGLKRLLERSGFEVELLLPGIDGPTLIVRRLLRGPKCGASSGLGVKFTGGAGS
jgi:hypothetical protein